MPTNSYEDLEQRIIELESQLQKNIHKIPLPYNVLDKNANFLEINDLFTDQFGYEKNELQGSNFREILAEGQNSIFEETFTLLKHLERVEGMELEVLKKSGDTVNINFYAKLDSSGNLAHCILRDVTPFKRAKEELRLSEMRFRRLYDSMNIGIATLSPSFEILAANKAYHTMLGYNEDELVGTIIHEITHKDDVEETLQKYSQLFSGEIDKFQIERKYMHKNGSTVHGLIVSNLIHDDSGDPLYALGCVVDITEKKKLEQRLRIMQRMDSLGNLSGGIAHDFNNILTGIVGNLDLAKLVDESSEKDIYIKNAMEGTRRATELISKLQRLSKQSSTGDETIDIHDSAKEILWVLKRTTDKLVKKINYIPRGEFYVKMNPVELHQVFLNLATNSLDAIADKGLEKENYIQVSAEPFSGRLDNKEGEYIHLTFEDTGGGIPESIHEKIFDPLFSTKKEAPQKGQGLGLSMVYHIITNELGGQIFPENTGNGALFHLYLPRAEKETIKAYQRTNTAKTGSGNLLFIDDDINVTDTAKGILELYGYNVQVFNNPKEGLDYFYKHEKDISLLVVDMIMPDIGGSEVFERIRNHNPDTKILLTSGHSHPDNPDIERADGYISKPYNYMSLLSKVSGIIKPYKD